MKTNYLWRAAQSCVAVAMMTCVVSCSGEDDPTPEPNPKDNGKVEFTINNDGGSGSGSSSSPAEVSKGDTLNMTISQKSSYTDSDGSVFTCEPKATIELFAKVDTVYVEDRNLLTDVKGNPEVKTSQSGSSPIRNITAQRFQIGNDQFVNFDLAYEVYKYINKANQTIEMPYVKVNQANLGGSGVNEKPTARSETVPKITIKPLVQTRGTVVTDTTWYEVNARFNLELESVNTKADNKQTVEFSVTYIGAVTTKTELSDPVSELSNTISIESGTNSNSSPFTLNLQAQLNLVLKQNSSYTDAYGNKTTCEPMAKINLFAQTDTVFVSNKDELAATPKAGEAVFTPSGENPVLNTATQLFEIGKETVQLNMSYEAYTGKDIEEQEIALPYLKLSPATIGTATISERSTSKGDAADTTYYDVKVPLKLEAASVNATVENQQTLEFIVTYLGAVVVQKEEPTLVKMEYRTGWTWEEAHHNLPLLYYAHVDRDRYYSNGEVLTDHFVDNGHIAELYSYTGIREVDESDIIRNVEQNDSLWMAYTETIVDDLSTFTMDVSFTESKPGKWDEYVVSKLYPDNINVEYDNSTSNIWGDSDSNSGWYFNSFNKCQYIYIELNGKKHCMMYTASRIYDQFLSIDGLRIDFLDYLPTRDFQYSVEDIPESSEHGIGKRITSTCTTMFLGRKFYNATIHTIYQRK